MEKLKLNIRLGMALLMLVISALSISAKFQQVLQMPSTQVVYVTAEGTVLASNLLEDFLGGILYSEDQGQTWKESDAIDYNYSKFFEYDGDIYALGSGCIIAKSADDGRTWTYVDYSKAAEPYAPKGYVEGCVCYGIAAKGNRLYVADLYCGILYSDDKGESWKMTDRASITYTDQWGDFLESVYALVTFKDKVYALGLYSVFGYDEQADKWEFVRPSNCLSVFTEYEDKLVCGRALPNDDEKADFLLSTDDFVDWSVVNRPPGLIDNYVRALESDQNNIYVGLLNSGIYFTPDFGQSWYDISEGLPSDKYGYYFTINLAQDKDYLYAAIYHYEASDLLSGVYRIAKADLLKNEEVEATSIFAVSPHTQTYNYGFEKKETYDVGIALKDPNLTGVNITEIRVPIVKEAQVTEAGYTVWLSEDLNVKANTFTPSILKVKARVDGDWAVATLDEPYTIPEEGVYAGYSFAMSSINTDSDRRPLVLTNAPYGENNMWLHTSHTYRSWQDFGNDANTSSALQVVLDANTLRRDVASFDHIPSIYVEQDIENVCTLTLGNYGNTPVNAISYKYNIDGIDYTGEVTLEEPLSCEFYGEKTQVEITLPSLSEGDDCQCLFSVETVNNAANNDLNQVKPTDLCVVPFITKHRPMVEEYTGLWCGYCPSGYVGLKLLNEHLADDVVIVSIHNADQMEVLKQKDYPYAIDGFPSMWIDRAAQTDPFFGDNLNNMYGLDNLCLRYSENISPCDIALEAAFDDQSKSSLSVNADVRFIGDISDSPYLVGFYLVADDLSDPTWVQTNYYCTEKMNMPIEMSDFVNGPSKVTGLHFDDVLVAYSDVLGVKGSLPTEIISGEKYPAQYKFDISNNKVIQDKDRLKAIAYVVDTKSGQVINANSTAIRTSETGIEDIICSDKTVEAVEFYDIHGIRLSKPAAGLTLKVTRYSDGSRSIMKLITNQ